MAIRRGIRFLGKLADVYAFGAKMVDNQDLLYYWREENKGLTHAACGIMSGSSHLMGRDVQ